MSEPVGRGLSGLDSTSDLLADWKIEGASWLSMRSPGECVDNDMDSPGEAELTVRPAGRSLSPTHGDSLAFLEGFSLRNPDPDEPISGRTAEGGPNGVTVLRQERPAGGSDMISPDFSLRDRGNAIPSSRPRSTRDLPGVGDVIAGFRIVQELGRGAFARVYLAEEIQLGGRLVAIKVSRPEGDEPRILARLQHTHIVPVHSACDDPRSGFRVLCMPFFGGANLAQVLDTAGGLSSSGRTGRSLVEALDQISRRQPPAASELARPISRRRSSHAVSPSDAPTVCQHRSRTSSGGMASAHTSAIVLGFRSFLDRIGGVGVLPAQRPGGTLDDDQHLPALQLLRNSSAIQAAVWIVARLAEGLDHAHSRGLLHRDLKPANILIAADGTPMLLDFNLAAESQPELPEGEVGRALLGGTLPYMAPEHLDAFNPRGSTPPDAVDERADIYALGLILFEVLAGEHPFPVPGSQPGISPSELIQQMIEARRRPPSLKAQCPDVPWSLDALIAKCLEFEPDRRYARARDLAEDLRRFLDDLPMKFAPEPSVRERAAKFARRHRVLCSSTSIALIASVLILALGTAVAFAYTGMQGLVARFQRQAFERDFIEAQFLLNTTGRNDRHLSAGLVKARGLFDRLPVSEVTARPDAGWFPRLTGAEQERVREQLVELIMLEARARVILAARPGIDVERQEAIRRAIDRLNLAARIDDHVPAALFDERARYHAALGNATLASHDRKRAAAVQPSTCHDWTLLGTSLLVGGDAPAAEVALRHALRRDCTSFWAWFMMGHCHFAQGRFIEAAGDFSACTAQGSQFAWVHFNRGLALARAGFLDSARDAYDLALGTDPEFTEALVNRALVELELDLLEPALADFTRAIELGRNEMAVLAARGEVYSRLGRTADAQREFESLLAKDPDNALIRVARAMTRIRTNPSGARDDLEHVLRRDPRQAGANYGMALLARADDPKRALEYLDSALDSDPNLVDAVQLRALIRARLGDPAALDDVDRLLKIPTAVRYYNAACAVAVFAGKANQPSQLAHAMELLTRAIDLGFSVAEAASDPDLVALRDRPGFHRLLTRHGSAVRSR